MELLPELAGRPLAGVALASSTVRVASIDPERVATPEIVDPGQTVTSEVTGFARGVDVAAGAAIGVRRRSLTAN